MKNNEEKNEILDLESIVEESKEENEELAMTEVKSHVISKKLESTLQDKKFLFNLNDKVDYKLDDKENEEIIVKDIVIKTYVKEAIDEKTKELKYNNKTGEVLTEKTIVTILIDENKKSYVTASKFFANRIKQLIEGYGNNMQELRADLDKGIKIKIIKNEMPDNKNHRYLSFLWN